MTQDQTNEAKPCVQGKKYRLLGILASVLVLLLLWSVCMRRSARANRVLAGAGLGRLPDSAKNLMINRKGGLFDAKVLFVCFNAPEADIADFANGGAVAAAGEPLPLGSFHLGPRFSSWMKWDTATRGRVYHFDRGSTSTWLAIDDGSSAIYVYVFHHRTGWLNKLKSWLPFIK